MILRCPEGYIAIYRIYIMRCAQIDVTRLLHDVLGRHICLIQKKEIDFVDAKLKGTFIMQSVVLSASSCSTFATSKSSNAAQQVPHILYRYMHAHCQLVVNLVDRLGSHTKSAYVRSDIAVCQCV